MTNTNQKQLDKFTALFNILYNLKNTWVNSNHNQKAFIETIIGAAIFYLPTNKKTFSGLISETAETMDKKYIVKEHQYPRKITAKLLLLNPPNSIDNLIHLYNTKYGIWNMVTKKENTYLRKYQNNSFISPEISYNLANVNLIKYKPKK